MSKQVTFNLPENCEDWKSTKGQWPPTIPPHEAAKWKPEQLDTVKEEGYYGKKVLQEDDLPKGLYRLSPCPEFISPFTDMPPIIVDTETPRPKPFFDDSREIALRRLAKQDAQLDLEIARLNLEIADKLYLIEKETLSHQKNSNNLYFHTMTGLGISKLYSEIEILKIQINVVKLTRQHQVKDEWEKIQRWTE